MRGGLKTIEELVAVQGFGRPVVQKDYNMIENFLSGSSIESFTPDTADMSLNPKNRQEKEKTTKKGASDEENITDWKGCQGQKSNAERDL
jgi:hypothetical protein